MVLTEGMEVTGEDGTQEDGRGEGHEVVDAFTAEVPAEAGALGRITVMVQRCYTGVMVPPTRVWVVAVDSGAGSCCSCGRKMSVFVDAKWSNDWKRTVEMRALDQQSSVHC